MAKMPVPPRLQKMEAEKFGKKERVPKGPKIVDTGNGYAKSSKEMPTPGNPMKSETPPVRLGGK